MPSKYSSWKEEAINALIELNGEAHLNDIFDKIVERNLVDLSTAKTPKRTLSRTLQTYSLSTDYGQEDIFYSVYGVESRKGIWGLSRLKNKVNIFPETADTHHCLEGATKIVAVNKYERSSVAREKCMQYHGCYCHICGIDFEKVYGRLGSKFIHVHHVIPLHEIKEEYVVDPIQDLIPVCPNCHAMLHREIDGRKISVYELKSHLNSNKE